MRQLTFFNGDPTLSELDLSDAPPEAAFDAFTTLARQLLGVPVSLVSIVEPERDRQFFKSAEGLPQPWAERRETPLSHSFCKYVRLTGAPLVVDDARTHPLVQTNGAVADLGVVAYLGVPILAPSGTPIGAFCVIDGVPREWSAAEIGTVEQIGACVSAQVRMKAALVERDAALQAARSAAASRKAFLAYLSHELRTPLYGISGAAELLCEGLAEGEPRRLAETIGMAGDTLLRQLDEILDLAKVEAGGMALDPRPFRPAEVVARVLALHRPRAERKGLKLRAKVSDGARSWFHGDDHRLSQIIGNLVTNAIKFTERGEVAVQLEAPVAAALTLRVRDTGRGMTKAELATLFDPFVQCEGQPQGAEPGTGLGMTIVRSLVEAMGGRVFADSVPGAGTTVTARLPLQRLPETTTTGGDLPEFREAADPLAGAAAELASSGMPVAPLSARRFDGTRALVADDHPINRLILRAMLEKMGVAVVLAETGEEAVALAATEAVDVLLFDLRMPLVSGQEALAAIRTGGGANASTPAIAVSGEPAVTRAVECVEAGFDGYLEKPLKSAEIRQALAALFDRAPLAETAGDGVAVAAVDDAAEGIAFAAAATEDLVAPPGSPSWDVMDRDDIAPGAATGSGNTATAGTATGPRDLSHGDAGVGEPLTETAAGMQTRAVAAAEVAVAHDAVPDASAADPVTAERPQVEDLPEAAEAAPSEEEPGRLFADLPAPRRMLSPEVSSPQSARRPGAAATEADLPQTPAQSTAWSRTVADGLAEAPPGEGAAAMGPDDKERARDAAGTASAGETDPAPASASADPARAATGADTSVDAVTERSDAPHPAPCAAPTRAAQEVTAFGEAEGSHLGDRAASGNSEHVVDTAAMRAPPRTGADLCPSPEGGPRLEAENACDRHIFDRADPAGRARP